MQQIEQSVLKAKRKKKFNLKNDSMYYKMSQCSQKYDRNYYIYHNQYNRHFQEKQKMSVTLRE